MTRLGSPIAGSLIMATTQSTTEPRVQSDPADAFDSAVWHNPEVCNHCFARVRDIDRAAIRVGKNNQRELDWEFREASEATELAHDIDWKGTHGLVAVRDDDGRVVGVEPRGQHSAQIAVTPRLTCLECGSVGCRAVDETLSRRAALSRVGPLVARLREGGWTVNKRQLREAIRYYKTESRWQGYDSEAFAAAAKVAISGRQV